MTPCSASPGRAVLVLALVLAVTGCGWAEWPPPASTPRSTAASAPKVTPRPAPKASAAPVFVGAAAVIVGAGDSVHSLARRHGISARAIIEANHLLPPYVLKAGRRIILPRSRVHTVRRGDTLSAIARAYGTDTFILARANRLGPPYTIYVGQKLTIPTAGLAGAQKIMASKSSVAPKSKSVARKTPPAPRVVSRKPPSMVTVPKPPAASGGFIWPVKGRVISTFGSKTKGLQNDGINIAASRGSPVHAAQNGVVAYAGNELRGFGNLVLIKHSGGWITAYAHNGSVLVKRGKRVRKGQKIATVGSTGSVTTPQLHFEMRKDKRAVDPRKYLRGSKV